MEGLLLSKSSGRQRKGTRRKQIKREYVRFQSRKCPLQIEELKSFEDDMLQMTENVRSRNVIDQFQTTLSKATKKIKNATKMLIPADKTRNLYEIDHALYEKLLRQNITKNYQTTSAATVNKINAEAQAISAELEIDDRMETMAMKQAFITLKDHKTNFENNLPCRLVNPAKRETGLVSKIILDRINNAVRAATAVNQWRSSTAVLEWFRNTGKRQAHIHKLRHCRILPLHNGKPTEESHYIRKEAHTSLQARHKNHHARQEVPTIRQRHALEEKG